MTADGKVHQMGEEFSAAQAPEFRIEIRGAAPLKRLEVIRDGRILLARSDGAEARLTWRDTERPRGVS